MKKMVIMCMALALLFSSECVAQGLHFGVKGGVLGNKASVMRKF